MFGPKLAHFGPASVEIANIWPKLGQVWSSPGQIRPKSPGQGCPNSCKIGRNRPNVGRIRTHVEPVGSKLPEIGRNLPTNGRIRVRFGQPRTSVVVVGAILARLALLRVDQGREHLTSTNDGTLHNGSPIVPACRRPTVNSPRPASPEVDEGAGAADRPTQGYVRRRASASSAALSPL